MNTVDIITRKRNGCELSDEEIRHMVMNYTEGELPDYQMAAFLMAVYFKGMSRAETVALTRIMKNSGDVVDLSRISGIKADKHSTGGVGDKTTLIVGPVAAACGVKVAKMSGRGLGFTGGTVDKLEAIPGFRTSMDEERFIEHVNSIGIAVIGQTGHIAPADKKIYALRDVTATVENLSLITSSIMSKKLASGSDAILLDVKCGGGAFMKEESEAVKLAELMVDIGKAEGKNTKAVITDMNQPLGRAVGNSLEVAEAVDVLKNRGPEDITELSVYLAGMMIYMSGKADDIEAGISKAGQSLADGTALEKFRELVKAQGGDPGITEDPALFAESRYKMQLTASQSGYVYEIDAMQAGLASQHTGAGRERKEDDVDHAAGVYFHKKTGEKVEKGEVLCTVYGDNMKKNEKSLEVLKNSVKISRKRPEPYKLIKQIVE